MTTSPQRIHPSPFFYEVWAGLMKAQGKAVPAWAVAKRFNAQTLRMMSAGSLNGEKAHRVRHAMIQEVGEEIFSQLHEMRLRKAGMLG